MSTPSNPSSALVPAGDNLPDSFRSQLPEILTRAGKAAVFAAEEFFFGRIRNEHTRQAYLVAIKRFLAWAEARGFDLVRIAPKDVGQYLDGLRKENTSVATRKQHLAALRHFFDCLVTRHALLLNPALSVRGERYEVVERPPAFGFPRHLHPGGPPRSRHRRHLDLHRVARRRRGHASPRQFL
jgi:hypothetical protein